MAWGSTQPPPSSSASRWSSSSIRSRRSTRARPLRCRCPWTSRVPDRPPARGRVHHAGRQLGGLGHHPDVEVLIENTSDPNRISFLVTGVYKFRVGVRRSGSTDTITSADLSYRKDGVNV